MIKKIILIGLVALSSYSCTEEELEAAAAALGGANTVHFTLDQDYGESVTVSMNGSSRSVSPGSGVITDACDGGNYVGMGTFIVTADATHFYTVTTSDGTQVGSGSFTASATCTMIRLE